MRYAIYFTPPHDDALTRCGAEWLGRDAFSRKTIEIDASRQGLVATPARYGFHATIKAPFELIDKKVPQELFAAFEAYCATTSIFTLPEFEITYSGNSFILGITRQSESLQKIAAEIVRQFEPFRAALSPKDIARRKPDQLSSSQRLNLERWGYPHVMDDFRFHITLTGPVEEVDRPAIKSALKTHFAQLLEKPVIFSGLGLFVEPARGENFHIADWQSFKA